VVALRTREQLRQAPSLSDDAHDNNDYKEAMI